MTSAITATGQARGDCVGIVDSTFVDLTRDRSTAMRWNGEDIFCAAVLTSNVSENTKIIRQAAIHQSNQVKPVQKHFQLQRVRRNHRTTAVHIQRLRGGLFVSLRGPIGTSQ